VLTVYGIETLNTNSCPLSKPSVATVLTVYGIETLKESMGFDKVSYSCNSAYRLRY